MKEIEKHRRIHGDTRVDRRAFLTAMAASGLSATAAGGLLSSSGALAQTTRRGGDIRYLADRQGPNDGLDPLLFSSNIDAARGRATYNGLVQILENMTLYPELAEEWSTAREGLEFLFKIRKGVEFHDGTPMTAYDVVWSLNRHLGRNSPSMVRTFFNSVKEWQRVDASTIKAIMNYPDADLPAKLGEKNVKVVKEGTIDFSQGIGTGPYRLEVFEPGVRSTHIRNENYWRAPANFDTVEIGAIADPQARVDALIAGEADLVSEVAIDAVDRIQRAEGVRVSSIPSGYYTGICCLKNTSPGENDDFVKGMQYIQNRERIVRSILKGHGQIGNDHPISPAYGAEHCDALPQRPFDRDKARFHLRKSGQDSAVLHVAAVDPHIEKIALMMRADLSRVGFDLRIKKVPVDGYWGTVWMKEPMNVVAWNMRPTANLMLTTQFDPQAAWNDTFWKDRRMGELLEQHRAENDAAKRRKMLCEMQALVHHGSGMVIPVHINNVDGVNERIRGIPEVPLGSLGAFEWLEFAWMNA
ncbi:ABC transporter substrate-binding protein [Thioalkalivibrio sp. HK1]|uniref:ABC transporter substrate-binding protein n=1 Tax=Thioalkalivibrio sp. HK1 TaxID=1469245 RepID=UPI0004719900|nr:ABC transporter substrate-binding protein [Thioalkalivibrio sp. HK1]